MPESTLRPRAGRSARALLLTVLGEFALPASTPVWTSTAIAGLAQLGVGERNARQALARLGDDGLLDPERVGRVTRWHLTGRAERLLSDGARRIYGFGASGGDWDGRWLLVVASVPEEERAKRHQLRTRLGFAGFGFLGPGIAVSPHVDRQDSANDVLRALALDDAALVFVAEAGDLVPDDRIIERAWDLAELEQGYRRFVAEVESREPLDDAAAFASLVDLVHGWRRFPFDDPEIPHDLLPPDWPGTEARALFDARRRAWLPAARRWYDDEQRAGDV